MAEVKVKITAQNEVRTGLQQALQETQKFSQQAKAAVSNTMTINPFKDDDRLGPLRELQKEIQNVRSSAQQALDPKTASNFSQGIGGIIARFAILIGVAGAVGKVIASGFDRLSEAVKSATTIQEQFNKALEGAGTATSLDGAIAGFRQLSSLADQTNKSLKEAQGESVGEAFANLFSGRPGQFLARTADAFTLGGVSKRLREQEQTQRQFARDAFVGSLERQRLNAEELAAAGADPKAIAEVAREQQRRQERERLENALKNQSPEFADFAKSQLEAVFAAEDRQIAAKEALEAEKEITKEKERQAALESGTRAGNVIGRQLGPGSFEGIREFERAQEAARRALGDEFGPGTAEAAAGGFRVDAAEFARQQGERLAAEEASFRGSAGASSLQRIGFASNEFFDTRQKADPAQETRRAAEFAKQILDILKKGEPLVLPSTN